jgi:hypothetical protein
MCDVEESSAHIAVVRLSLTRCVVHLEDEFAAVCLPQVITWALRERQFDMEWINENLFIFWPVATEAYVGLGRRAIIVDTTSCQLSTRRSVLRQKVARDSDREFVIVLIKLSDHISTYQVQTTNVRRVHSERES